MLLNYFVADKQRGCDSKTLYIVIHLYVRMLEETNVYFLGI